MKIGAVTIDGARVIAAGPSFLTTMQIPILAGRELTTATNRAPGRLQ